MTPAPELSPEWLKWLLQQMRLDGWGTAAMVIEAMAKDSAFWKQLAQINARSAAEIADKLSSAEARVAELEREKQAWSEAAKMNATAGSFTARHLEAMERRAENLEKSLCNIINLRDSIESDVRFAHRRNRDRNTPEIKISDQYFRLELAKSFDQAATALTGAQSHD
jgi:hypothetical protein